MANKRKLLLGSYDTAEQLWTLVTCNFSDPVQEHTWVKVPGRHKGPIDVSTALTDGDPVYGSRTLTATLECSEGTRLEREARIEQMVNQLDGYWADIVLPDDITVFPDGTEAGLRYIRGTLSVKRVFNNLAHAQVQVTAICEPWKYSTEEHMVRIIADGSDQSVTLTNSGRKTVVPLLVIENTADGKAANIMLVYGDYQWMLGAGTYSLPDLVLKTGEATLLFTGRGTLTFTHREAVL